MRFYVKEESKSGHCCFEYTVMECDAEKIEWSGEIRDRIVCETFEKADAYAIMACLNEADIDGQLPKMGAEKANG